MVGKRLTGGDEMTNDWGCWGGCGNGARRSTSVQTMLWMTRKSTGSLPRDDEEMDVQSALEGVVMEMDVGV